MAHGIQVLVDVRSFRVRVDIRNSIEPRLSESLGEYGNRIQTRAATRRPPNATRRFTQHCVANASFRAYADHMETEEFRNGVKDLLELAGECSHGGDVC